MVFGNINYILCLIELLQYTICRIFLQGIFSLFFPFTCIFPLKIHRKHGKKLFSQENALTEARQRI